MIEYKKHILENGLRLIVHQDISSPIAAINVLYDVGSRDENPDKTGFAHLFEHLMFGGSLNIPDFDSPLQRVGGENNAFTSNDLTNYYISLPANNIETAFWLESDRMLSLKLNKKSLDVQRNVVIEEYKQRYLNQPYGDTWLLIRPLVYKKHPYQWATIGKNIEHIEKANMDDVESFYEAHYHPSNAILSVVSPLPDSKILELTQNWFGQILKGKKTVRTLPPEPVQNISRQQTVKRPVPFNTLTLAFHMCGRNDGLFYVGDLLSDILSSGKSSRLYEELVHKRNFFSSLDAFITADIDPGLFVISGKLMQGIDIKDAEKAIWDLINPLTTIPVSDNELEKAHNRTIANIIYSEISNLNKAYKLAYAELLNDLDLVNTETARYKGVTTAAITEAAKEIFTENNCSTLFYLSDQKEITNNEG